MAGRGPVYALEVFRSAFKLPPSSHPAAAALTASLFAVEDLGVFRAPLVRLYLKQLWKEARCFFAWEAVCLLLGVCALSVYAGLSRSPGWLGLALFLQTVGLASEAVERLGPPQERRCRDAWWLIDLFRFAFTLASLLAHTPDEEEEGIGAAGRAWLLTLGALFQGLRAFSVFFYWRGTRVLLRTVIAILRDMRPFLLFVLASTAFLALLLTAAAPAPAPAEGRLLWGRLFEAFRLGFGDFAPGESLLEVGVFVVGVVALPLVLMNMLIAIMGDTYDRFQEQQEPRDFQELAGPLHRYLLHRRLLCCCHRSHPRSHSWKYLFYSVDSEAAAAPFAPQEEWEGRVQSLKRALRLQVEEVGRALQRQLRDELGEWKNELEREVKQLRGDLKEALAQQQQKQP